MSNPQDHNSDNADSMEAVRDLLFGKKTNEINDRFSNMEKSLREAIERVEERVNGRFESIDKFLRVENDSVQAEIRRLGEKVRDEERKRESEDQSLGEVIGAFTKTMEEKLARNESRLSEARDQTRKEVFSQRKSISDELDQMRRDILKQVEDNLNQLASSAADRSELGSMLIDMGMKIQPGSSVSGEVEEEEEVAPSSPAEKAKDRQDVRVVQTQVAAGNRRQAGKIELSR